MGNGTTNSGIRAARANKAGNKKLPPISVNENWAYQPDYLTDLADMRKNPIPFVGVGEDARLAELFEDGTVQDRFISEAEININELKTLQPFVLQSGIDKPRSWDGSERPYVIVFEGQMYLYDGNHRVAKALLDGRKTMTVTLSMRSRRKKD